MEKIKAKTLVREFQTMLSEHWRYERGKAEKGTVDCSGAFVYAYRLHGKTIAHGSNAIARKYIAGKLLPVSQARPGMAAFKVKEPGDGGWDLPEKYAGDPDQRDYYHIGLIDEDGRHVLNAQSVQAGFTRTDLYRWNAVGYLKDVDYDGADQEQGEGEGEGGDDQQEGHEMRQAIVTAKSGSTVNVRQAPIVSGKLIDRLPIGALVDVVDDLGDWMKIQYRGDRVGYMVSNYLEYANAPDETAGPTDLDVVYNYLVDLDAGITAALDYVKQLRDKGAI